MKNGYQQFFNEAKRVADGQKGIAPVKDSPEERLRRQLAKKIKTRKKKALTKKQSFPVSAVVFSFLGIMIFGLAYTQSEALDEWIGKIEISVFGSAQAETSEKSSKSDAAKESAKKNDKSPEADSGKSEKSAESSDAKEEKTADAKVADKKNEVANIKQWSKEELSFFSKLNDRKKELDAREAELTKLEEELQNRKLELDKKIKQLEAMRAEISKTLKTRVATDQEKVDKLVQVYSGMKAQQAARVIETLNEDLAVEILDKMKKKNASEVLDMMNPKKARRLSELLTGYEKSVAQAGDVEREPSSEEAAVVVPAPVKKEK